MVITGSGPAAGEEGGAVELWWGCCVGTEAGTMPKSGEQSTQRTVCAFHIRVLLHFVPQ